MYANYVGSALPTHQLRDTLQAYHYYLDDPKLKSMLTHPLITNDMRMEFFTNLTVRYDPDSALFAWMLENKVVDLAQDGYAWFYTIQFEKEKVRQLFRVYPPLEQQLREARVIH
jgi:hypothetical protein